MNKYFFIFIFFLIGCKAPKIASLSEALPQLPDKFPLTEENQKNSLPAPQRFFTDSLLQTLIEKAISNNPDFLTAQQQIIQFEAIKRQSTKAMLPQITVGFLAGSQRFGEFTIDGIGNFDTNLSPNLRPDQRIPNPTPNLNLNLFTNWELDVWGKLNQRRKAAASRYQASLEAYQWMKTQLVAEIAITYFRMLSYNEQIKIIRKNIELQKNALALVKIQKDAGRVTALAVEQLEAQVLNSEYRLLQARSNRIGSLYALQRIAGSFSDSIPTTENSVLSLQLIKIAPNLPAQALLERPDVKQALYELSAAGADLKSARAAFFPSLHLFPQFGYDTYNTQVFINPSSWAYHLIGGITAPLFNQGQLKATYKISEAQRNQSLQQFKKTAINAYTEVAFCVRADALYEDAVRIKTEEVATLDDAVRVSQTLFSNGYASYIEVINSQKMALDAALEQIEAAFERLQNRINLYKALGGSW